jgi:DNA-binding transcriptional LysR family regulator
MYTKEGETMTLQQLKYIVKVAEVGSVNEAAKALMISQPSLSSAVIALEEEIGTVIFHRSNRGVSLTREGIEFLGYARQVLTQSDLLEAKYIRKMPAKQRFSVSTQHYTFAANAFVELVKSFGLEEYEFVLNETTTYQVIEDVKNWLSEIGVLYLSDYNEAVIRKMLRENQLVFETLFIARPHVFLCKEHPLATRESIDLEALDAYPCITYNQGAHNAFYFSEEILSTRTVQKRIVVSDRAAVVNFLIGLNGYIISSGIFPRYLHGDDIVSVPLSVHEKIEIGTVMRKDAVQSPLGKLYIKALRQYEY